MGKPKVMHVLRSNAFSGAESVAISIIASAKERVDSIYVSPDGSIREHLDEKGIDFYPLDRLGISGMRQAIRRIRPDIIHAHDYTAGVVCAATMTDIPIISHLHNDPPWIGGPCLKSFAYAGSGFRFRKILTVSDAVMDEFVFGNLFRGKAEVIGNPVDPERIRRSAAGGHSPGYSVAFLGRLSAQKDPHRFLDIVREIRKTDPAVTAVMIGDGELRGEIERRINEEGLAGHVTLAGFQKNPYPWLASADVLCMPSGWEGYGLAAVEGLALGKPVVCSGAGGLKNIVDESCGGICGSVNEYADAIRTLLNDAEVYRRKSMNAAGRADSLSNTAEYTNRICRIYKSLTEQNDAHR